MSDNESDYYSDSNSESESENEFEQKDNLDKKKQPVIINAARKYGNYIEETDSDTEVDDSEPDKNDDEEEIEEDEDDDDDDDEIVKQKGGVEDLDDDENYREKDDLKDKDDIDSDEDDDIEINEEEGVVIEKGNKNSQTKPKKTTQLIIEDQDNDYDDEYDENYLQKFDNELNKNYITEFHPECLNHNYDEVLKLTKVVRNNENIIIDPLHKTLPYLTKYEKTRVLGQRAKQIETGAKPLVKVPENIIDGYIIAELELREKKIPFIIKRPIPGGAFEYWKLQDLENINF
jgi:DNA-directed RNA polymerase I, II, and III subunit RPABC2